jgi:hypothetical protein
VSDVRTIAVMQPYFFPYAGYFRLLAASDVFVLFDDVQFPRRGRVHRCELAAGRWLTLPLAHAPVDTLIKDLQWSTDARTRLDERLARLHIPAAPAALIAQRLKSYLYSPLDEVIEFLEAGLRLVADALELKVEIVRSSTISVDASSRGQERIIALVQALGGHRYINAPGGRKLYSAQRFQRAGIDLRFLMPYTGKINYLLPALFDEDIRVLRDDVRKTCKLAD